MELERHTPVAAYRDGSAPAQFAFERVQTQAGDVHVLDAVGRVQSGQLHPQSLGMGRPNARSAAALQQPAHSLVPKRLDQGSTVLRCASRNNRPETARFESACRRHREPLRAPAAAARPAGQPQARARTEARPRTSLRTPDGSALCPVDRACDARPRAEKPRGRGAVPRAGPGKPSPSGFLPLGRGAAAPYAGQKAACAGQEAASARQKTATPRHGTRLAGPRRPRAGGRGGTPAGAPRARPMVARAGARDPMHGRRSDARRPASTAAAQASRLHAARSRPPAVGWVHAANRRRAAGSDAARGDWPRPTQECVR